MRNLLKKGIQYINHRLARGTLILVYHRISESTVDPWSLSVSPEHFVEHLSILRRSFHPTSLQTLARALREGTKLKPKSVVITFDDGYADNLHHAKPILERFDCPATVFVVTGAIGSSYEFWWDELASLLLRTHPLPERLNLSIQGQRYSWQLGKAVEYREAEYSQYQYWRVDLAPPSFRHELYKQLWQLIQPLSSDEQSDVMKAIHAWVGNGSNPPVHRILDKKECIELAQAEQIEIGAHTIGHPSLASLPRDLQCNEILGSKKYLEKLLNQPIKSFSYPFGKRKDYGPEAAALVNEAGFNVACCNESGIVNSSADLFQLPRIHISDLRSIEFENRLLSKFYA